MQNSLRVPIFALARGQNSISVKGPLPRTAEGHGAGGLHSCVDMVKRSTCPKLSMGTAEDTMARKQRNAILLALVHVSFPTAK